MVLATKKNCQRVLAASLRVVSAMTGNPPLGSIFNYFIDADCGQDIKMIDFHLIQKIAFPTYYRNL